MLRENLFSLFSILFIHSYAYSEVANLGNSCNGRSIYSDWISYNFFFLDQSISEKRLGVS